MSRKMSAAAVQRTITKLADPDVNTEIELASSVNVARNIIRALPGVKRLRRGGPEAAKAVLTLLQQPETRKDENLSAIGLQVLEAYPSPDVKRTIARQIVDRRYRGLNRVLAAETFLKAAGIQAERKDWVVIAHREARKIYPSSSMKLEKHGSVRQPVRPSRQKPKPAADRKRLAAKK